MSNPFRDAIDVLHDKGWGRTTLVGHNGSVCIMGALGESVLGNALQGYDLVAVNSEIIFTLHDVIFENYPLPPSSSERGIWRKIDEITMIFNDGDNRSVEEVTLMLDKAAVQWEERL